MKIIVIMVAFGLFVLLLGVARYVQVLVISLIKRNTRTYADIKARRKLDEWERQFDDE